MPKLLFIIGMQKSGTSLLNRLLMYQPFITNPFLPEGKFFWGDDPPFSPKAAPCGHLYQKHLGQHGHALDAKDFYYSDQTLLNHRITEAKVSTPILVNKNPYNSVRIPWLKRMFPDCKIVAITRKPQANIYSLLKKYQTHKDLGVEPEDGWWGIKPLNWQELLNNDKLTQCANQWTAINEQLYENIHQIDYLLSYSSLCNNPGQQLKNILSLYDCSQLVKIPTDKISCMDQEYLTGGQLESKNRMFRKTGVFSVDDAVPDFKAFSKRQIETITELTEPSWKKIRAASHAIKS